MSYYQRQTLKDSAKNIAKPWRSTWLDAIRKMDREDGERLIYAASSAQRMAKIERTVELWGDYRQRHGLSRIELKNIKAEDLLPLLDVHYYRRRLANPDAPTPPTWEAMNTVLRPKECDGGYLPTFESHTTFGVEIEAFDLDKVVGRSKDTSGREAPITKAHLLHPLLQRLIPDVDEKNRWKSIRENGVIRQGKPGEGWEISTPILDSDNAKYLNAAVQLIKGMEPSINSSSAVHVHLGINDGKVKKVRNRDPNAYWHDKWNFRELKNLKWREDFTKFRTIKPAKQFLINYIMLEDKLSFLDHRLVHSYKDVFDQAGISTDEAIKRIVKSRTFEELLHATRPDAAKYAINSDQWKKVSRQRAKVNVVRALEDHGTIEVRHHPGTAEPSEITAWVRFLDRLMKQSTDMAGGILETPHKPNKSEQAKLEALVDDFIRQRGGTHIVNDADLPPEKRALISDAATNFARPIRTLDIGEREPGQPPGNGPVSHVFTFQMAHAADRLNRPRPPSTPDHTVP